jgi:hypothetical protein
MNKHILNTTLPISTIKTQEINTHITLSEAINAINSDQIEIPWATGSLKKILGSTTRLKLVYKQLAPEIATDEICCDPEQLKAIFEPYLKTKTIPAGCGFKRFSSVYTCYSNCKRLFELICGIRKTKALLKEQKDGWAGFFAAEAKAENGMPLLNASELIPLNSLAGLCRTHKIDITDLDRDKLVHLIKISPAKRARTIKSAAKLIDHLSAGGKMPCGVLPGTPIGDLSSVPASGQWRAPELHPEFLKARDDYIAKRQRGTRTSRLGSKQATFATRFRIGEGRGSSIRTALNWFHHGLIVAGYIDLAKPFPWDKIQDAALLLEISELDADGEVHRDILPETRGSRIKVIVKFLDTLFPGYAATIEEGFYDCELFHNELGFISSKSKWKEQTTLDFISSPERQRVYYGMADKLFREAENLISRWDEIGRDKGKSNGISKAQGRALDLATIAVYLAITTRLPLRMGTLLRLRIAGAEPHVIFPQKGSKSAKIHPTSDIIKNCHLFPDGIPMDASRLLNPTQLLRWYLDKVHPLILKHKVCSHNRQPGLLFAGMSRIPLSRKFQKLTTEAGFRLDAHMVRHLAGSILFARGVSVDTIAELLGILPSTVEENYLYVDRQRMVQDAVNGIGKIYEDLGL